MKLKVVKLKFLSMVSILFPYGSSFNAKLDHVLTILGKMVNTCTNICS